MMHLTKKLTLNRWLARHYPEVALEWKAFQINVRRERARKAMKERYEPTGNPVGRPSKDED